MIEPTEHLSAVRIEGEVTRDPLDLVRDADAIIRRDSPGGLAAGLWQAFAVLKTTRSVERWAMAGPTSSWW